MHSLHRPHSPQPTAVPSRDPATRPLFPLPALPPTPPQITRTVHVFDPCARNSSGVERTCPDTRRCSVLGGRCGSITLLPEIVALATAPPANQSAEPLPSAVRTIVSPPVKDTQVGRGKLPVTLPVLRVVGKGAETLYCMHATPKAITRRGFAYLSAPPCPRPVALLVLLHFTARLGSHRCRRGIIGCTHRAY